MWSRDASTGGRVRLPDRDEQVAVAGKSGTALCPRSGDLLAAGEGTEYGTAVVRVGQPYGLVVKATGQGRCGLPSHLIDQPPQAVGQGPVHARHGEVLRQGRQAGQLRHGGQEPAYQPAAGQHRHRPAHPLPA
jgi:hypothetical protein